MRYRYVVAGLAMCAGLAWAQPAWFTVVGDPLDRMVDTVQVDPDRVTGDPAADGGTVEMRVRVNRAAPRYNWDGIPYRSYESRVVFDCRSKSAAYVHARYYAEPLWRGEPHHEADYADAPRPLRFRDMTPNPTARIVRAACRLRPG
ncbi:hypothetical protein M2165_000495 [Variovorax sp. TBS-050B]|uniref:surface-adhesin E family protein n=1 Tax=Variovorax sp. TBS-050B TaxID=2940551 RepID=UPI0024763CC6|nr:surface-adhesin E family protein [Variovorax sp. TBS-050B]MDH6590606.1 hypothetical protein [Variovorax sp. TBS-050B]